jgi:hypothetical protein
MDSMFTVEAIRRSYRAVLHSKDEKECLKLNSWEDVPSEDATTKTAKEKDLP